MASDQAPKIGDVVHGVTRNTTTQVRTCRAGVYLEPVVIPRSSFVEGELGDKMYEQHRTGHPAKVSYVCDDGATKILSGAAGGISYMDTQALTAGGYHLPKDCPYGI